VIAVEVGLLVVSGIISLATNIHFGVILFGLGMLSGVAGAVLGGSNPYAADNPRMHVGNPYESRSARKIYAQIVYNLKASVPHHSFENVLLITGCIAVIFSLPFLCQIMFA
ncbi:MAG: hypothetical protein L0287_14540, partial [Anaerolineae bacterium]|nr:hypothetical protein [Anaerolineae bacterium]